MIKFYLFLHFLSAKDFYFVLLFSQAHAICHRQLTPECNFGLVQSIMLPPYCVSIPRTDVPLETIIGAQNKKKGESVARKFSKCCECDQYSGHCINVIG